MSFNQKKRRMNFEAMEKRELFTADLGMDLAIPDAEPEQMGQDRQYFVADSFSFGVEREMKESGEKAGTEDINIGVGELQECTISKSMDMASAKLAQFAINGNSPGQAEIDLSKLQEMSQRPTVLLMRRTIRCGETTWEAKSIPKRSMKFLPSRMNRRAICSTGSRMCW